MTDRATRPGPAPGSGTRPGPTSPSISPMTAEWHPAFEEYCETIFELSEEGVRVVQARISERLGISRPSVSGMVKRLAAEGLVHLDGAEILLTDDGRALAERVVRRHRLAERFLCDVLGLPWAEAHHEAGKWEHVIGPAVEDALVRVLGNPTTCPHGNPIPGSEYEAAATRTLASVSVGADFVVSRIPESLEFQPGVLEFLESCHIVPGASGQVAAAAPDGTVTLDIDGRTFGVGSFAADRILVTS
jgi:DtxR family Mn-dependent transcriptional regulator